MVGYLSFLKVGPQLLKFIPGDKARDLKNWLTVYGYWNQGGLSNCVAMFTFLVQQYYAAGKCLHCALIVVFFLASSGKVRFMVLRQLRRHVNFPGAATLCCR